MTPTDLRTWRARMGWPQQQAADQLGLSLRWYRNLERGVDNTGKAIEHIDRRTALACAALAFGLPEWR